MSKTVSFEEFQERLKREGDDFSRAVDNMDRQHATAERMRRLMAKQDYAYFAQLIESGMTRQEALDLTAGRFIS